MNWRTARLLCLDTETTGVDRSTDRIVEVGGYSIDAGDVEHGIRLETLINPGVPIPEDATAIHGISDITVGNAKPFALVAEQLLDRVDAADVLCGYNWPFDKEIIAAEMARVDADFAARWEATTQSKPVIDILTVVRLDGVGRWWSGKGRHKLDAVAKRIGIPRNGVAHRASADCELSLRILFHFAQHIPADAHEASEFLARNGAEHDRQFQEWLSNQPPMA